MVGLFFVLDVFEESRKVWETEQQASAAFLVAVEKRLSYKSREQKEALTFWCFCVKTKAHIGKVR